MSKSTVSFTVPLSSAVNPEALKASAEARREAATNALHGLDRMFEYYRLFAAFRDVLHADPEAELALSEDGRDGLKFLFGLLADDAKEESSRLSAALEELVPRYWSGNREEADE